MVEWKKLDTLLDFEQPTSYLVKSTEYDDSYDIPVLTAGQSLLLGYTNETKGIYNASKENPTIIFDDFTTSFHWIDFDFKVKSSAMKMLRPKKDVNFRFVYYSMCGINFVPGGHQRHWISKYSQFEIPIPSISEQNRIVGILDTFTASIENLKEQITQRRKQFEHYRDQLLDLEGKEGVEMKKLEEACEIRRGIRVVKKQLKDNALYPVFQNSIAPMGYYDQFNRDGNMPYIICAGSSSGSVGYCCTPFWAADDCFTIESSKVNRRYTYYALKKNNNNLFKLVRKGSMPRLPHEAIDNMVIPIPSLQEQSRIVSILDTFEASIANLEAQLSQREKQYEYYRNKLLTFE
jgi:type I restriction enzyme S subunit